MNELQVELRAVPPAPERRGFRSWTVLPLGLVLVTASACDGEVIESPKEERTGSGGEEASATGGASSGGAAVGGVGAGGAVSGGAAAGGAAAGGAETGGAAAGGGETGGAASGGAGTGGSGGVSTDCPEGSWLEDPFTSEASECVPCPDGTYCVGGVREYCVYGTWDHDEDPLTACVAHQVCVPGEFVASLGSASEDRTCEACVESFSTVENAETCKQPSPCADWQTLYSATNPASDNVCWFEGWTRQFGSTAFDNGFSITLDAEGNVYVAGYTYGVLPGQEGHGVGLFEIDAFVAKYDDEGTEIWKRQFGTYGEDRVFALALDDDGNVFVGGSTTGVFPEQVASGHNADAFVAKLDASGDPLWAFQFGGEHLYTEVRGIAVNDAGDFYVAGHSEDKAPWPQGGDTGDAFVRKYDAAHEEQWARSIASDQIDLGLGIGLDDSGNVYAAGVTRGEVTDYQASWDSDAFLVKFTPSGDRSWIRQFGTTNDEGYAVLHVDASGNAYVAGDTDGSFEGYESSIYPNGYLRKYDTSGAVLWTREFGSDHIDGTSSVTFDGQGSVYVAGTTWVVAKEPDGYDLVVRKFDVSGDAVWERTFGSNTAGEGYSAVAANAAGVYMTGFTWGALPGQSSQGEADAFVLEMAP